MQPLKNARTNGTQRMAAVQDPVIPIVADLIRSNPGTISLGQGVVRYGPPPQAIARITDFLVGAENHKYQPVHGIPQLLDSLARKLREENGIVLGPEQRVFVTAGANMGFLNAVLAITDVGDEIILPRPFYFNHEMAIAMSGARPVAVDTDEHYQLVPDRLEGAITPRTRAIVTISPNNPSGAVYPEETLRAVNDLCRRRGLYHISDEAYEYFVWNGARHFSSASIEGAEEHTISLHSLSKSHGFASWRIGYMVLPRHLFEPVRKIQDTNVICPPVISQWAAVGALEAGSAYCRAQMSEIAESRQIMLDRLAQTDTCTVPAAEGAFYLLLNVRTTLEPMELVERLVREHRVAVIPGSTFGIADRCLLRVSYGPLIPETAAEGADRLVRGLEAIVGQAGKSPGR